MSGSRAPYMEWAKTRPKPEVDLAGSNLLPCTLDDLPGAREAVDIAGESPDGYPPLKEAIARHHGVGPERVATASGCSGATFLACAATLSPGDDVLMGDEGADVLIDHLILELGVGHGLWSGEPILNGQHSEQQ